MDTQKGKELFISVLKYNIELTKNGFRNGGNGVVESLEDVLEKVKEGEFDSIFENPSLESEEAVSDDSYSSYLFDESQRWAAMGKDYEKYFKKLAEHMTPNELMQSREKYIKTSCYIWGRHNGYSIASEIMAVTSY